MERGQSFQDLEAFQKTLEQGLRVELSYPNPVHLSVSEQSQVTVTPAAVLILIGFDELEFHSQRKKAPSLLYIRRTETVDTHKGQIAFPGGLCDPVDQGRAESTALRETEEEVGISTELVRVIGRLPSLITTTAFSIQPVVGILKKPIRDVKLRLNENEIQEAMWISLEKLLEPNTYRKEYIHRGATQFSIDVYQANHHRIWGATGSMTKNLLDRLGAAKTCK